jgi:hypothetical protein
MGLPGSFVEIEVRPLEGKAEVVAVAGGIEHPLGDRTHGGKAGTSVREGVSRGVIRSPIENFFSKDRKIRAELAAEISYEGPEPWTQLVPSKKVPQFVVGGLEEVLADVAQEVKVTAEDGDL